MMTDFLDASIVGSYKAALRAERESREAKMLLFDACPHCTESHNPDITCRVVMAEFEQAAMDLAKRGISGPAILNTPLLVTAACADLVAADPEGFKALVALFTGLIDLNSEGKC